MYVCMYVCRCVCSALSRRVPLSLGRHHAWGHLRDDASGPHEEGSGEGSIKECKSQTETYASAGSSRRSHPEEQLPSCGRSNGTMLANLRTKTDTTSEICWEKSCNWVSMRLHSITKTRTCMINECLLILDGGYYNSPFPSSFIFNVILAIFPRASAQRLLRPPHTLPRQRVARMVSSHWRHSAGLASIVFQVD